MKRLLTLLLAFAMLLSSALLFTACGDDSDGSDGTSSGNESGAKNRNRSHKPTSLHSTPST